MLKYFRKGGCLTGLLLMTFISYTNKCHTNILEVGPLLLAVFFARFVDHRVVYDGGVYTLLHHLYLLN